MVFMKNIPTLKPVKATVGQWPSRVFDLAPNWESVDEIIALASANQLPAAIVVPNESTLKNHPKLSLHVSLQNMVLPLENYVLDTSHLENIKQIDTEEEAYQFANIATESFKYHVDGTIVINLLNKPERIRLFLYHENNECLGCGLLFFDTNNNAGLHMIGTLPQGRGKGIANKITRKLLEQAQLQQVKVCVLNASTMGQSIYEKLGFRPTEKLNSYIINL
jgi:ribosomal protein S18 acetylase RimI-like enzyme